MIRHVATHSDSADGAFTVDVEDYFHVSSFAKTIGPQDWDHCECRIVTSTRTVLEIAAQHGVCGTFFVLGWVAERFPELVREIRSAGHEIGCHSRMHQLVYELGPDRFRSDLVHARNTLEEIIGEPVRMYRAPSFSITRKSLWALEILAEEGFDTDSSIYPVRHDVYGMPGTPRKPWMIPTASGVIREFPGMTSRVGGMTLPVGGGGYLRLLPWNITARLLRRIRDEQCPLNVYVHPWELDPEQPRIPGPLKSRFRHYQNLRTTAGKLHSLLSEFHLTRMSDVLRDCTMDLIALPDSQLAERSTP